MFTRRWLRAGVALIALALGLPSAGLAWHVDAPAWAGAAASWANGDVPPCHGYAAAVEPADTMPAEQADGDPSAERAGCANCLACHAACHAAQALTGAGLVAWTHAGPHARPSGPGDSAAVAFITAGPERPPRG